MTDSPEYRSYGSMKQRILNPRNKRYRRYGGRGIKICDRWLESFENFYADMGPRPPRTSLERRNNDGDYTLENCYWATPKEQMNNTCRNVSITYQGRTQTIAQWARETGLPTVTIRARLRRGWTTEQIFTPDRSKTLKRPLPVRTRNMCVVSDCGRPTAAYNGELCRRHYQAQYRGGRLVTEYVPPTAKIDPQKAIYLRSDEAKQRDKRELAQTFGISVSTINDIRRGKTWISHRVMSESLR